MNPTLTKALLALLPACLLLSGSTIMFVRERTPRVFIQLLGASGFALVVLAHVRGAAAVSRDAMGT